MRRLIVLAPLAMLSTACAVSGPATPASALGGADARVPMRELVLPESADRIAPWRLPPESPWARYEKATLFAYLDEEPLAGRMPDVGATDIVRRARAAAARLAMVGAPAGTLWIVDLRGPASVAFGATWSRLAPGLVAPVVTFNNWPADHEVVPAEQTLAALVTMAPHPLDAGDVDATPVFLLDAWRLAYKRFAPDPEAVDNRYVLSPTDFPDAETLRGLGIARVVYVVEDRGASSMEEDDLNDALLGYQEAGIGVSLVDLEMLSKPGATDDLSRALAEARLDVEPRHTILEDLSFHSCARGGFGGVRAECPTFSGTGPRVYSAGSPHIAGSPHVGSRSGG